MVKLVSWFFILLAFFLVGCGQEESLPTATLEPQVAEGKRIFSQNCGSCHAIDPDTVIVGPSLAGIAGRAENRVAGVSGRDYLQQAILNPEAYLVEGFDKLMPTDFGKRLSGEELDALMAYLLTLQ